MSNKTRRVLIVDATGILYRAANRHLKEPEKTFTQHANEILAWVLGRTRPQHILCVFDKGGSYYRKAIFPGYKRHRGKRGHQGKRLEVKKTIEAGREEWKKNLTNMGIKCVEHKGVEADDIIAFYAQKLKGGKIVIATDDHDLHQLARSHITIFSMRERTFLTRRKIRETTGYHPWELRGLWALTGDKGDSVPGFSSVAGLPAELAYLKHGKDFEKVLDSLTGKARRKAELNFDLVGLHPELVPDVGFTWQDLAI